jgi:hypothetical protein
VAWFFSIDGRPRPRSREQSYLDACNEINAWLNGLCMGKAGSVNLDGVDPWCIVREGNLQRAAVASAAVDQPAPAETPAASAAVDPLTKTREVLRAWEADRDAIHASPGCVDFHHNLTTERSEAWSALLRAKVAASKKSQGTQARVVIDNDMDHLLKDVR